MKKKQLRSRNHPLENVIGNLNQRTLRSQAQNQSNFFCFISTIEPKNVNEALTDDSWIVVMQEELNQFIANDVWELVPQPRNITIIGTKWVFRNKLYENDIVSRNKARLVAQGYNQQEGIDYDETYALVARLESIRILLAYACALDFKLFQMDVKHAFLNSFINEEVYVAQPLGFIDFEKPDHVYKLKKALYGLKQTRKACFVEFECLLEISDQICPRFILEFYSQYQINYSDEGEMFIEFVIQNQFFSYSLEEFAQILDIPCEGACVFTDKWSLDKLAYGVPTDVRNLSQDPEAFGRDYSGKCLLYRGCRKPLRGCACNKSESLERIVAREEAVTPLLLLRPLTNQPPLILTMMMIMEMAKGARVQALLPPFVMSIR
ncbi:retrovirus-related pol polyprotein from transposon TNT 1-94 [Tanacetum coccineum]